MRHPRPQPAPRSIGQGRARSRGLTLVEGLCVLAITALLLGSALPLLDGLVQGQRLRAVADLLETDIHLARSTALRSGLPVRLAVQAMPGGNSCYLLYTGPAAGCQCGAGGEASCQADARLLRLEVQRARLGVVMAPLAHSLVFSGSKATVTPTVTLRVQAQDGRAIHQVVNIMGRVRSCSPQGRVSGLQACN